MSVDGVQTRRGAYADSVTLMQVSQRVGADAGVSAALIAMATELNLDLARAMNFTLPEGTGPNDLLIAIRADNEDMLADAIAAAEAALSAKRGSGGDSGLAMGAVQPPRTTASALARTGANLALISVPGQHAFAEAIDALESGADVMIFSDNVPIAHEVLLKRRARELGRLVMGPDCGTAMIGGVGLGFANSVRPGPVGIVAASGTGAQQLMSLLELAGLGISGCLGVGGRDLSAAVGAISTITALDLFNADPDTELIVVVSKPPAAEVADLVREHTKQLTTAGRFGLLGEGQPDLTQLAEHVLRAAGVAVPVWPTWGQALTARPGGALRGLYSGGTLCDEAMVIASSTLGPIYSNIPLRPEWALGPDLRPAPRSPAGVPGDAPTGHLMIDFGDDALTLGRPHPMIDGTLRSERLAVETADPATSVVLLDVVLGFGADPDPAAMLAPAIASASRAGVAVVVALVGTERDPQGLDAQGARLASAGAAVFASNAAAARYAVGLL